MQSRIIGRNYEIVRELGRGGMGVVYEGRHLLTRRRVAIKLLLESTLAQKKAADALRRFEREARAAGSIDSRHVVSILDTGVDPSTNEHYLVMELLRGQDLRALIRRRGPLPAELVLQIASQVCQGLGRAHEQGIIHRDIKAANIFLARRDGGEIEVKILDFGIAKLRVDPLASGESHDLTRSGSVLGSPLYMSPEQATGSRQIDARADIWSLGVVMYEALTGTTPHDHPALGALILAICSEPARPIRERAPGVSNDVAALVHRALALEPSQRYPSARAMQAAIDASLPGGAVIRDDVLEASPESSDADLSSSNAEVLASASPTPPAPITVTAVTYAMQRARHVLANRAGPFARAFAFVAFVCVVAASVELWRSRTDSSPVPGDRTAASKPTASMKQTPDFSPTSTALASMPAPSAPAEPSRQQRDSASLRIATRPARFRASHGPRLTEVPGTKPLPLATTVATASPAQNLAPVPAESEPAIDRHLD